MRKLIGGKVRDTDKLETVCGNPGDPSGCYSTYSYLMRDERDGRLFHWFGHHWAGLGPDTLDPVADPAAFIEEQGYELAEDEAERVEELLAK